MPTRGVSCKANGADRYARRANRNSLLECLPVQPTLMGYRTAYPDG
jgi:hypothetical protein